MDFTFTDEQQMLSDTLRAFFSARYPFADRARAAAGDPGYRPEIWTALGRELAILELAARDTFAIEQMIVMEEAGRALALEPLAESLTTGWLLNRCGGARAEALLGKITAGEAIVALAWDEQDVRDDLADIALVAARTEQGWRLDGVKTVVVAAPWADWFVVAARTAEAAGEDRGLSLFLVPKGSAGVTCHAYPTIDGRRASDMEFSGVVLSHDALIGEPDQALALLEAFRDRAIAAQAAEAVGILDRLLADTLGYLRQREQFGASLASFQALQHRMVDMYLQCELARAAALLAAMKLDGDPAARAHAASCAKVTVSEACRFVGQQAVQLHGGMGMTDDLAIGHYFRRATMIEGEWGSADWHLARLGKLATREGDHGDQQAPI